MAIKHFTKDSLESWLKENYKEKTDSGRKSSAYSYMNRIEKVCENEKYTLIELAENIDSVLTEYGKGGIKESLGNQSNDTVINALKAFKRFIVS